MQEQGSGRKTKLNQKEDAARYNSSKAMRKIQCSKHDSNEKQKKKQGSVRLLLSKAVQFCATFISTAFTYEPFASMDTFNIQQTNFEKYVPLKSRILSDFRILLV